MPKINTSVITDKSITKEKLNDELQKKINNIGNLHYLHTNDKNTLVNSINEIYNDTVNGKNLVANAIKQKGVTIGGETPSYQLLHDKILEIKTGNYELIQGDLETKWVKAVYLGGSHKNYVVTGKSVRWYRMPKLNKIPLIFIITDGNLSYSIDFPQYKRRVKSDKVYTNTNSSSDSQENLNTVKTLRYENINDYINFIESTKCPLYNYYHKSGNHYYDPYITELVFQIGNVEDDLSDGQSLTKVDDGVGCDILDDYGRGYFNGSYNQRPLNLRYMALIPSN